MREVFQAGDDCFQGKRCHCYLSDTLGSCLDKVLASGFGFGNVGQIVLRDVRNNLPGEAEIIATVFCSLE